MIKFGIFTLYILILSFLVATLGSRVNKMAIDENGGIMPVVAPMCDLLPGTAIDEKHSCATEKTRFKFLCDWISIAGYIDSPGDIMILGGIFVFRYIAIPCVFIFVLMIIYQILKQSYLRLMKAVGYYD